MSDKCPITLTDVADLPNGRSFKINAQTYDVEALFKWAVKNKTVPHTRRTIGQDEMNQIDKKYTVWISNKTSDEILDDDEELKGVVVLAFKKVLKLNSHNVVMYNDEFHNNPGTEPLHCQTKFPELPTKVLSFVCYKSNENTYTGEERQHPFYRVMFAMNIKNKICVCECVNSIDQQEVNFDTIEFHIYISTIPGYNDASAKLRMIHHPNFVKRMLCLKPHDFATLISMSGGKKHKKQLKQTQQYTKTSKKHIDKYGVSRVVYTANGKEFCKKKCDNGFKYVAIKTAKK